MSKSTITHSVSVLNQFCVWDTEESLLIKTVHDRTIIFIVIISQGPFQPSYFGLVSEREEVSDCFDGGFILS